MKKLLIIFFLIGSFILVLLFSNKGLLVKDNKVKPIKKEEIAETGIYKFKSFELDNKIKVLTNKRKEKIIDLKLDYFDFPTLNKGCYNVFVKEAIRSVIDGNYIETANIGGKFEYLISTTGDEKSRKINLRVLLEDNGLIKNISGKKAKDITEYCIEN